MATRTLPGSLLLTSFIAVILCGMLPSCSKSKVTSVPFGDIDTSKLLTARKWTIDHFWFDMNNNGRIDSGETIPGLDFVNVFIFSTSGTVRDSTAPYLTKSGTWYFKDNYHTAFYTKWNTLAPNLDLYYIINISDTALVGKRWGTNETWYFK